MKKKFSRILGVALTLAMVASLFVFAVPAAAQPGDQTWAAQIIPTATNNVLLDASDVGDICVSSDGTIYAINNTAQPALVAGTVFANQANAVLVSTDGGHSFTGLPAVGGGPALFLRAIAVAPDDSDTVAVTDGAGVFVTSDGGTTWTQLPAVVGLTTHEIMDIDVSPSIPGAFGGRHYAMVMAEPTFHVFTGNAQIYGPAATWTIIGPPTYAAPLPGDYMACKFSPSYMGDRGLALVWNAGPTGLAVGVTNLSIISQPGETAQAVERTSAIGTASEDYGGTGFAAISANAQVACDIALPEDWDYSITAGEVTYVSVASTSANVTASTNLDRGGAVATITGTLTDDVWRIDAGVAVDLDGSNAVPVHSIAHHGTIDDGTLFLGRRLEPSVRYTLNPTSMAPTWKTTQKAPTGDNIALPEACTRVVVAPDGTVYVGTRDSWTTASAAVNIRSAFSVSTDAGVTFNQTALIDVALTVAVDTVVAIDDFMLTPDGLTVFLSTDDGTDLSLWESSVDTSSATWERIYCRAASPGPSIVRLGGDYADNPSIFWADTTGAVAPNGQLWVSHDGGAVFRNRTPPILIVDITVESGGSAGVLYMSNAGNIYTSTNGGNFFGLAEPSLVAAIRSLSMAPMYPAMAEAGHLIVGGTAEVSYSTDSAASFTLIDTGLAAAGNTVVGADEAYATNNTIYCTGLGVANVVDGSVYRFVIGTDTDWTDLGVTETTAGVVFNCQDLTGLALSNGVLYAADDTAARGVYRTVGPLWAAGTMAWERMNTGPGAVATFTFGAQNVPGHSNSLVVVNNVPWAIDTSVGAPFRLLAYDDPLATAELVLTAPADGYLVAVDPVSGRAIDVGFSWQLLGTGTGLVDDYEWQIAEVGTNFGAPRVIAYVSAAASVWQVAAFTITGLDAENPVVLVGTTGQCVYNLRANTEYEWRVRARDQVVGDTIRGQWSESRTINIQAGGMVIEPHVGPQLQGPLPGATGVSLTPGFSWAPISGATLYRFWLATDPSLADDTCVEGTPVDVTQPAWQVPAGTLLADTDYFWGVQAIEPTESVQSIATFHTLVIEEYVCPFCGETFTTAGALDSHIAAVHPAGTPAYMWAIIIIGAVLMIAVIMLIMKTRRVT